MPVLPLDGLICLAGHLLGVCQYILEVEVPGSKWRLGSVAAPDNGCVAIVSAGHNSSR